MANVQNDAARTYVKMLLDVDLKDAEKSFLDMENESRAMLTAQGFSDDNQELARFVDVRYSGQEHSVTLQYPNKVIISTLSAAFAHEHEQKYGHSMEDPIEVTTFRLRATGRVGHADLPKIAVRPKGEKATSISNRSVYLSSGKHVDYALYIRENLLAGDAISGPAVIAEHTATTVIHSGDELTVGPYGELVIDVSSDNEEK